MWIDDVVARKAIRQNEQFNADRKDSASFITRTQIVVCLRLNSSPTCLASRCRPPA